MPPSVFINELVSNIIAALLAGFLIAKIVPAAVVQPQQ